MHNLSRRGLRAYRPRYLRARIGEDHEAAGPYPTPAGLFFAIGAILLIALCVGLAANLLANLMAP